MNILDKITEIADQGHSQAQYRLGCLYRDGAPDIPQDYKKAVYWLTKAAEQGHVGAQFALGEILEKHRAIIGRHSQLNAGS